MKTLRDFDVKNKRVLVRADFNVPLDDKGNILDDFRIQKTLHTIRYLMERGAKIILMSHLGRPKGEVVENLRLGLVQNRLMEYLDVSVTKAPDCIGPEIEKWTKEMMPGEILLLENLRFHKEEEENDEDFAKAISRLGDAYVNDAFGASHRAHASIVGIAKLLPSGAGLLLEKEVKVLSELMQAHRKPLIAVIGGKKVEDKTKVINKISKIADFVLLGNLIVKEIKEKNISLDLPQKIVEAVDDVEGKDIGPKTIEIFKEKIIKAKTVFFAGVLGQVEREEFTTGTEEILRTIIESGAFSVLGGGEMAQFVSKLDLIDKFNHVSTGGGAMLEFLSGEELPGIRALE